MIRIAIYIILICGITTANEQWSDHMKCLQDNKLKLEINLLSAQKCVNNFVDDNYAYGSPNTMDYQLKHVFKSLCRKQSEIRKCAEPLKTIITLCANKAQFSDYDIGINISFQYICKDEAQRVAELIADPNQRTCMQNILPVILHDECDLFKYLSYPIKFQPSCEEATRNLDCLFKNVRRKCEVYELLNYLEDFASILQEFIGECSFNNDRLGGIKLEL